MYPDDESLSETFLKGDQGILIRCGCHSHDHYIHLERDREGDPRTQYLWINTVFGTSQGFFERLKAAWHEITNGTGYHCLTIAPVDIKKLHKFLGDQVQEMS
jgi:hypothetical protein